MTNVERIRQMTDKEFVDFLDGYGVIKWNCPSDDTDCMGEIDCARCWLKWLQEEANDD